MRDHELEAASVKELLNAAVQTELKRHVLEPGGTPDGYVGFYCLPCRKAFNLDAMVTHLDRAVEAALNKAARPQEQ